MQDFMNEKVYKTMKSVGASNIVLGILLIVGAIAAGVVLITGIVSGTMLIINGARLIKKKYELTI